MDSLYPPWSSLIIFMFLGWSFLVSCTLCQSWQKGGEIVVPFLRFYMLGGEIHASKGGNVFHLVRGSACLILLIHRSCDHVYIIVLIFLYMLMYVSFTYPYMCSFFSLFIHIFLYVYAIYYFYFTQKCLDEFCLKCFRNTGCQSLLAINSLLAKFFKSLY